MTCSSSPCSRRSIEENFSSIAPQFDASEREKNVLITVLVVSIVSLVVGIIAYRASVYFLPHSLSFMDPLVRIGRLGSIIWIANSAFFAIASLTLLTLHDCCMGNKHRIIDQDLQGLLEIQADANYKKNNSEISNKSDGRTSSPRNTDADYMMLQLMFNLRPEEIENWLNDPLKAPLLLNTFPTKYIKITSKDNFQKHIKSLFPLKEDITNLNILNWQALSHERISWIMQNHQDIAQKYLLHTTTPTLVKIPVDQLTLFDLRPALATGDRAKLLQPAYILDLLLHSKRQIEGPWMRHIPLSFFDQLIPDNVNLLSLAVIEALFDIPLEGDLDKRVARLSLPVVKRIIAKMNESENVDAGVWLKHLPADKIHGLEVDDFANNLFIKLFGDKISDQNVERFAAIEPAIVVHCIVEGTDFLWGSLISQLQFTTLFANDVWPFRNNDRQVKEKLTKVFSFGHHSKDFIKQLNGNYVCINNIIASGFSGLALQNLSTEQIQRLNPGSFPQSNLKQIDTTLNALFPINQTNKFGHLRCEVINLFMSGLYDGPHLALFTETHIKGLHVKEIHAEYLVPIIFPVDKPNKVSYLSPEQVGDLSQQKIEALFNDRKDVIFSMDQKIALVQADKLQFIKLTSEDEKEVRNQIQVLENAKKIKKEEEKNIEI